MDNEQQEEQSQLATVLIGILIVVAGFLVYTVFTNQEPTDSVNLSDTTTETETTPTPEEPEGNEPAGGSTYTVEDGDTLWKIAEKAYGDGYQWTVIADANGIDRNNASVEVGNELMIPAIGGPEDEDTDADDKNQGDEEEIVEPTEAPTPTEPEEEEATPTPTVAPTPDDSETTIEEDHTSTLEEDTMYIVQQGDTLWDIAEHYYGEGTQWTRIFDYADNEINMYTASNGNTFPLIHAGNTITIPAS